VAVDIIARYVSSSEGSQVMRRGNLLLAGAAMLAMAAPAARAGECRDLINRGRLPPRSDAECAQYDAGMQRHRDEQATKDTADMAVIDNYFHRNPIVTRPNPCQSVVGSSSSTPWMVSECRHEVKAMTKIDAYLKAHPNAPRPDSCSLPLRSGFLGECVVELEAAAAPPPPKPEWHRVIRDTVGCYRNGVYGDGRLVGTTEGCTEIHAGQVFLLQPIQFIGDGGSVTFLAPLSYKQTSVSNGVSSLTLSTDAFDRKVLHCRAKPVLLHQEVTCDD
jgi:hypothetical protein